MGEERGENEEARAGFNMMSSAGSSTFVTYSTYPSGILGVL